MSVKVLHGDCLEILPTLAENSIDAVVTDPPYHLTGEKRSPLRASPDPKQRLHVATGGFMGKEWDGTGIAFKIETWHEVFRVLKPGAHLLAFGGTRTYHRMACAIEDARFEIRDQIGWCYGSGFPKSRNIGNGWGTALKPAWEPIVVARKPLSEKTVAANVLKWGTGAINIDGCRVPTFDALDGGKTNADYVGCNDGWRRPFQDNAEYMKQRAVIEKEKVNRAEALGRWPANLIHDGSDEVLAGFPESDGCQPHQINSANERYEGWGSITNKNGGLIGYDGKGSAARFFYSAKADADDRLDSKHPTVKPVDLTAYLCRLITPPKGVVLDPFAGSGSTAMACMREGFDCVLIEREAEYVSDINRRIGHVSGADTPLFARAAE